MSGNPKSKGRTPSWIREELRKGLAQALPAIKHALRTGNDLRTGARLSWMDFAKTVEVASRMSMPAQSQLGGMDGAPFNILVGAAAAADEQQDDEPRVIEAPLAALPPHVVSAEPEVEPAAAPVVVVRVGAVPRRSSFGPGVG